ncbi:MAG: DUF2227 family putative metal-binding protein [Chlamydiales bacterium]|nr:DUF2227 family putative metal-binding protein [Chlamydiales bacterium]
MAQYKTHAKFNLFIALPSFSLIVYFYFTQDVRLLSIFIAAFAYSTLFMNPDLDLAHQIKFLSIRGVLTSPFRLYSKIFSHRGFSHSIVFGTLSRLLFLAVLALLCMWIYTQANPSLNGVWSFILNHQTPLLYAFSGIFLADLSHLALDI